MAKKSSGSLLSSYRKKRRSNKSMLVALAALLILVGLVLLVLWATGVIGDGGLSVFSTKTPTPTMTFTPTPVTPTNTPTITSTFTETPTITSTPTLDGPFQYIVQAEDFTCYDVSVKFDVSLDMLLYVNNIGLGEPCIIREGDVILIPTTWQEMPTSTPVPTDLAPGTIIDYYAEPGATLLSVSQFFRSTIPQIITETNRYRTANNITPLLTETTALNIGDLLRVPANIATPVPSATATRTQTPQP